MEKFNNQDLKLLYELDKNSRQSYNQLARLLRSNKNTVRYRIEHLKKMGIIKQFLTIIDVSNLGVFHQKVFLRVHNLTPTKREEFINYIINTPDIVWAASCEGSYDFILSIRARNLKNFKEIFMDILTRFDEIIKDKTITSIIEAEYLSRDYLINKKRSFQKEATIGKSNPYKDEIDERDQKLLLSLAKDSLIPTVDIADSLNLSAVAISSRIRKLEEERIIQKYSILPNNNKLGVFHYKVLIGLHNFDREKENTILNYLRNISNVVYVVNALGSWELEVDIEIDSHNKFREIIMDLTNNFSQIIKDYTVLQIYEIHKYNLFPKVI